MPVCALNVYRLKLAKSEQTNSSVSQSLQGTVENAQSGNHLSAALLQDELLTSAAQITYLCVWVWVYFATVHGLVLQSAPWNASACY